jgi:photosystem II core protein PsbZ
MLFAFQIVCTALIRLSFVLVVGISVSLALPEEWARNKGLVIYGAGVWFTLVLVIGVLNSFVV